MESVEIDGVKNIISDNSNNKKIVTKALNEVLSFFNEKLRIKCKIIFLEKRNEMNKIKGKETPQWLAGFTDHKTREIFIFSEDNFDKETNHSKEEFFPILKHELSHIIIDQNFGFIQPLWLNEGLAEIMANQSPSKKKEDIRKMHTIQEWKKNHSYGSAFSFCIFLIKKFKKENFISFLKTLDRLEDKEIFEKKFNNYFKADFNKIVNEWLSQ